VQPDPNQPSSPHQSGGSEEEEDHQPDQPGSPPHSEGDAEEKVDRQPVPTTGDVDNESIASDIAVANEEQAGQRDPLRNAHYWVLSGHEAVGHRLDSNYRTNYLGDLSDDLIRKIETTLRESHSMSTMYKTASEMLQGWLTRHPTGDPPEFHMVLLDNRQARAAGIYDPETHPHLTEPPVVAQVPNPTDENEQVALIWINKKGEPPELGINSGVMETDRRGERKTIGHTNPNKFPATYPILNPRGDQSWRYGLRLNGAQFPTSAKEAAEEQHVNEVYDDDEADDNVMAADDVELRDHEGECY
jgi:hypothetical protein